MGDLIDMAARREQRRGPRPARAREDAPAEFFFDLASPFTYLTAESVERAFTTVEWTPATSAAMHAAARTYDIRCARHARLRAQERADQLRLPLAWPDDWPRPTPSAMRVAHFAAQAGRGGAFVLSASRLAFAGGFDLEDPDVLLEAAAAAGLPVEHCERAARESRRDGAIETAARRLLTAGVDALPALAVGPVVVWGPERVPGALAFGPRAFESAGR